MESVSLGAARSRNLAFNTLQEANEHLLRFFEKRYFGHSCSGECGPVDAIDVHKSDDLWGMIRE